jgi:hypothetical protein
MIHLLKHEALVAGRIGCPLASAVDELGATGIFAEVWRASQHRRNVVPHVSIKAGLSRGERRSVPAKAGQSRIKEGDEKGDSIQKCPNISTV